MTRAPLYREIDLMVTVEHHHTVPSQPSLRTIYSDYVQFCELKMRVNLQDRIVPSPTKGSCVCSVNSALDNYAMVCNRKLLFLSPSLLRLIFLSSLPDLVNVISTNFGQVFSDSKTY